MVTLLRVIGAFTILGGLGMGLEFYKTEVPLEGYMHLTREVTDWTIFFTWFGYGVVAGILFFAFAQVLDELEENNKRADKQIELMEKLLNKEG